jgi:membrane protein involved in colicin uptake
VGIRLGVFDENVYKQSQCTNVLRLWDASRGFINELRSVDGKDTLFQDFERLANKWQNDPIKRIGGGQSRFWVSS